MYIFCVGDIKMSELGGKSTEQKSNDRKTSQEESNHANDWFSFSFPSTKCSLGVKHQKNAWRRRGGRIYNRLTSIEMTRESLKGTLHIDHCHCPLGTLRGRENE